VAPLAFSVDVPPEHTVFVLGLINTDREEPTLTLTVFVFEHPVVVPVTV
jgi:hypothetical protein